MWLVNLVAQGGIYGLGWALFIYMMIERRFERKKYAEIVVHIVTYFTKVHLVDRSQNDAKAIFTAGLEIDKPDH